MTSYQPVSCGRGGGGRGASFLLLLTAVPFFPLSSFSHQYFLWLQVLSILYELNILETLHIILHREGPTMTTTIERD